MVNNLQQDNVYVFEVSLGSSGRHSYPVYSRPKSGMQQLQISCIKQYLNCHQIVFVSFHHSIFRGPLEFESSSVLAHFPSCLHDKNILTLHFISISHDNSKCDTHISFTLPSWLALLSAHAIWCLHKDGISV